MELGAEHRRRGDVRPRLADRLSARGEVAGREREPAGAARARPTNEGAADRTKVGARFNEHAYPAAKRLRRRSRADAPTTPSARAARLGLLSGSSRPDVPLSCEPVGGPGGDTGLDDRHRASRRRTWPDRSVAQRSIGVPAARWAVAGQSVCGAGDESAWIGRTTGRRDLDRGRIPSMPEARERSPLSGPTGEAAVSRAGFSGPADAGLDDNEDVASGEDGLESARAVPSRRSGSQVREVEIGLRGEMPVILGGGDRATVPGRSRRRNDGGPCRGSMLRLVGRCKLARRCPQPARRRAATDETSERPAAPDRFDTLIESTTDPDRAARRASPSVGGCEAR